MLWSKALVKYNICDEMNQIKNHWPRSISTITPSFKSTSMVPKSFASLSDSSPSKVHSFLAPPRRHHCPCRLLRHLSCHSLVWPRRRSILSSWSRHCQPSPSAPPAAAPPAARGAAPGVPPYHHQWDTFCCFCEWKNKVMEQMKITKIENQQTIVYR